MFKSIVVLLWCVVMCWYVKPHIYLDSTVFVANSAFSSMLHSICILALRGLSAFMLMLFTLMVVATCPLSTDYGRNA